MSTSNPSLFPKSKKLNNNKNTYYHLSQNSNKYLLKKTKRSNFEDVYSDKKDCQKKNWKNHENNYATPT